MEGAWGLCLSQRRIPERPETRRGKPLHHAEGGGGCLGVMSLGLNRQKHSVIHKQHGTTPRMLEQRRATRTTRQKNKINGDSRSHGQPTAQRQRFWEASYNNAELVNLRTSEPCWPLLGRHHH